MPRPELAEAFGGWDLKEEAEGGRPQVDKKMRARDRVLANDLCRTKSSIGCSMPGLATSPEYWRPADVSTSGADTPIAELSAGFEGRKLYFSQAIIWVKEHPVLTRKDFMGNHEWCFYGWREGAGHKFLGPNNAVDVWNVKKVSPNKMIHLTEKPVELAVRAMQYSSHQARTSWTFSAAAVQR